MDTAPCPRRRDARYAARGMSGRHGARKETAAMMTFTMAMVPAVMSVALLVATLSLGRRAS